MRKGTCSPKWRSQAAWRLVLMVLAAAAGLATRARAEAAAGPILVEVDARDVARHVLHATLRIPAEAGPLTLLYPKNIPGEHGPNGPIVNLTGLRVQADGRDVEWHRDLVEWWSFHVDVPAGAHELDVALDYLLSDDEKSFLDGPSSTSHLLVLDWYEVVLYPQGQPASRIAVQASVRLPVGWQHGTALPELDASGDTVTFQIASLETLVDSPVLAGDHFARIPLAAGVQPPHELDLAADSEAALAMPAETRAGLDRLVAEAGALFGSRHYRDYHFLLALSDHVPFYGLEHHESSDNRASERTLVDDQARLSAADLLPHEFVHSWNGKYRRPADLLSPDFQAPMQDDLLWVYEGLTQHLGGLLAARSGLLTPEQYRDYLAWHAARLDATPGRTWRPLQDTANLAFLLYDARPGGTSWRRSVDFYDEGDLIWLEVDTMLRHETQGKASLDDFCRRFHGGESGPPEVVPYALDDVVAALHALAPRPDWAAYFHERLAATNPHPPMGGLEAAGWKLAWTDKPNALVKASDATGKTHDYSWSLGFKLSDDAGGGDDGTLADVIEGSPAQRAGMGPSLRLVAVNGRKYSPQVLDDALVAAHASAAPLELLAEGGEFFRVYSVDCHTGPRFPHLERINGTPDLLTTIAQPLASPPPSTAKPAAHARAPKAPTPHAHKAKHARPPR